jgi:hypothetical protein
VGGGAERGETMVISSSPCVWACVDAEPTSGLDAMSALLVMEVIKRHAKRCVTVCAYVSTYASCMSTRPAAVAVRPGPHAPLSVCNVVHVCVWL